MQDLGQFKIQDATFAELTGLVAHMIECNEDNKGDLPAEHRHQLVDMLRARGDKVDAIARVIRDLSAQAEVCANEERLLRERAARKERKADSLRAYAIAAMRAAGLTKVEGSRYTLTVIEGRESVDVFDGSALPSDCVVAVPATSRPDKDAIRRKIKSGVHVPGASLTVGNPTLRAYP